MSNQPALVDKVALVLGGSRGIGAAIARRLAADGAMVCATASATALGSALSALIVITGWPCASAARAVSAAISAELA